MKQVLKDLRDIAVSFVLSMFGVILITIEILVDLAFHIKFFWGFEVDKKYYDKNSYLMKHIGDYRESRETMDDMIYKSQHEGTEL